MKDEEKSLIVFQGKDIRRVWHKDEWYFSVTDIVAVLTESSDVKQYVKKLRQRDPELNSNWGTICTLLEMIAPDGKKRKTNTTNTEGAFRILQSIPSKKAEPFKRWLAKVGHERIKEIENPELAQERAKKYYELKGYPKSWIDKRIRGIAIRQGLTDEWQQRGVEEGREYALLTDEISKATFGLTTKQHKQVKGLETKFKNQNLRDHMNDFELIFNMLGEASTTAIAKKDDSQGFTENKESAKKGGKIAAASKEKLEKELGQPVVSTDNYLDLHEKKKLEHKKNKK